MDHQNREKADMAVVIESWIEELLARNEPFREEASGVHRRPRVDGAIPLDAYPDGLILRAG